MVKLVIINFRLGGGIMINIESVLIDKKSILKNIGENEKYYYEQLLELKNRVEKLNSGNLIREDVEVYDLLDSRKDDLLGKLNDLAYKRRYIEVIDNTYNNLPLHCKKTLKYLFQDGQSWDWISTKLEVSKTTISRYRRQGLDTIKSKLDDWASIGNSR